MNINQIRYFITLVEKHSFTTAARECVITQSALSQQIKNLEEELKVALLVRKGRSFELTPSGQLLYQRLVPLLNEFIDITNQVIHVGQNSGSTLRLGLLSSMDHHQLAPKLTEQVLNNTGLELSVFYSSHDELYERFSSGNLHAFISDESRLTQRDSYHKLPLFATKMYVEFPQSYKVNHQGVKKFKLETSELTKIKLAYVCNPDYLAKEQQFLSELMHVPVQLIAVESIAAGRKAVLSPDSEVAALLFTRSLLKGDYQVNPHLIRYELLYQGNPIKRHLSCYAKLHMHATDLKELCQIMCALGGKRDKESLNELRRQNETPVNPLRSVHSVTGSGFTYERMLYGAL